MFTAKRYATRGVHAEVDLDIQLMLWSMIDHRKETGIKLDYLQVFELAVATKDGISVQQVIHNQECPPVKDVFYLPMIETPINKTIWVMDNDDYCTMLLPEEY